MRRVPVFIERIILSFVILLQAWVFLVVPTDNNGDPNEYLDIARRLFSGEASISFNRFIGYPAIIKAVTLDLSFLNLLFLFQSVLFISALIYFANSFSLPPLLRSLVYLPGLIPAVAYMQKLVFPDGIILSLILILVAQLRNKNLWQAAVAGLVLTAIKLVFLFVLLFLAAVWVVEKQYVSRKTAYAAFSLLLLGLIPAVYFIKPFPLYQTFVQVLIPGEGRESRNPTKLQISCGGAEKVITDPAILANITTHNSDEFFMPLGEKTAAALGCSKSDMQSLQRKLILQSFLDDPSSQALKIARKFIGAMFVFTEFDHLYLMLQKKYQLAFAHYDPAAFYEDTQLRSWRDQNMPPLFQPGFLLLYYGVYYQANYNGTFIKLIFLLVIGLLPLTIWKSRKSEKFRLEVAPIVVLIAAYGFMISCFAFVYDRYVYVNLFLWMAIVAVSFREILGL